MPLTEAELVSSTRTLLGRQPFNLVLQGHLLPPGFLQLCSHDFPTEGQHYLIAGHHTEGDSHGCTLNTVTILLLCPAVTHTAQIHGCIMGMQDVSPESALLAPPSRQGDLHWHHLLNARPAQFSPEQSCSDVRPGDGHRCPSVDNNKVCLAPVRSLAFRLSSSLLADMLNVKCWSGGDEAGVYFSALPLTCFLSPNQSSLRQFFLAQSYHQSIPRWLTSPHFQHMDHSVLKCWSLATVFPWGLQPLPLVALLVICLMPLQHLPSGSGWGFHSVSSHCQGRDFGSPISPLPHQQKQRLSSLWM